jgi:hypothetical protein
VVESEGLTHPVRQYGSRGDEPELLCVRHPTGEDCPSARGRLVIANTQIVQPHGHLSCLLMRPALFCRGQLALLVLHRFATFPCGQRCQHLVGPRGVQQIS